MINAVGKIKQRRRIGVMQWWWRELVLTLHRRICEQKPEGMRKLFSYLGVEGRKRAFQAEGTTSAKALRWEL